MIEQLWHRYARIWSLDGAERPAELQACVTADVSYIDPNVALAGREPFSAYMGGFQKGFPGHSFHIRAVRAHHDRSLARWDLIDAEGKPVRPGISFATHAADGRLAGINGFFGDVEALLA